MCFGMGGGKSASLPRGAWGGLNDDLLSGETIDVSNQDKLKNLNIVSLTYL